MATSLGGQSSLISAVSPNARFARLEATLASIGLTVKLTDRPGEALGVWANQSLDRTPSAARPPAPSPFVSTGERVH